MTEPIASYRFQLGPRSGFDAVIDQLDHLGTLGVSHVYLSPVAEAVPGSGHGYDVVDHTRVRVELGGADGLDRLFAAAADRGMAVVVDHVPNHVSVSHPELQHQWWAMLRDGPDSPAAAWFDVDASGDDRRVILPVLPAPLSEVLASGGIERRGDRLVLGGTELPLAVGTESLPLSETIERQHYRLVHWRSPERNVRRFFTIDDLVAVQVEVPAVAAAVDTLPTSWAGRAGFGGLRIDHVDGLTDPLGYLRSLRARIGPSAWLVVEKILAPDEVLPASWPVDGTTGYETTRVVEHVLLDPSSAAVIDRTWVRAAGDATSYDVVEDRARREVLAGGLRPDLDRTVRAALGAVGPGHATDAVERAVVEVTVGMPRYRTYLPDDPDGLDVVRRVIDAAASRVHDDAGRSALAAVGRALVEPSTPEAAEFVSRWQRLTGPAMAKGAEDRAFFRYLRLASLCEVGGEPGAFGTTVADLHEHASMVQRTWPRTMVAGSTHDAKRSADVRARSTALTWHSVSWSERVAEWTERLASHEVASADVYHVLQTVVTCPGLDAERLGDFAVKAAREAEVRTAWIDADEDYESRIRSLAADVTMGEGIGAEIRDWAARLDADGTEQALVSLVLRLTLPGIPDLYQGAEEYSFRLTDPDNRAEPDRTRLAELVSDSADFDLPDALRLRREVSRAVVIRRLLGARRRHRDAVGPVGTYGALTWSGSSAGPGQVVAFERRSEDGRGLVVVARTWPVSAADRCDAGGITVDLPVGPWRRVLDDAGGPLAGGPTVLAELLRGVSVAVLER